MAKTPAERLLDLFAGFESAHGTHGRPVPDPDSPKMTIRDSARTVRKPVTTEVWESHLAGERPLGVIPIRKDGTCVWGSIDYDVYDADLVKLVQRVQDKKLPLVPCTSKSGGLHFWLFLTEAVQATNMVAALREIAASIGMAGSEIFPKQTQVLTERGDVGNWIVMPYFGSTYDGLISEQVGIKRTGAHMTIEEFLHAAEKTRVTPQQLTELAHKRQNSPRSAKGEQAGGGSSGSGPAFSDGPPCLQHLAAQKLSDGRNRALFMMAIYARRVDSVNWRTTLEQYNRDYMEPPLEAEDVQTIIKSIAKRDYQYTCKVEPMCGHCNAMVCRTRKFGIGEEGDVPRISSLSRMDTDPPVWFVDVGDARVMLTTEQLMDYKKFQNSCMAQASKPFVAMKQADWNAIVNGLAKSVVVIEAPPDVGNRAELKQLLDDYIINRSSTDQIDDIASGRVYEDEEEGVYKFTLNGWRKFCLSQKSDFSTQELNKFLKDTFPELPPQKQVRLKTKQKIWVRELPRDKFNKPDPAPLPSTKRSPV